MNKQRMRSISNHPNETFHRRYTSERPHRIEFEREDVHSCEIEMDNSAYGIIISTDKRKLWIRIQGLEDDSLNELEMSYSEAYELMNDTNDYDSILQYLAIENGNWVLNVA